MIALDLDGTLLNDQHEITPRTRKALVQAQEKGIHIVLCTGRPYLAMKHIVHDLGLDQGEHYIITFNGGLIQKANTGEIIAQQTLSRDDIALWYQWTERLSLPLNVIDEHEVIEPLTYPENYPSQYLDYAAETLPRSTQDFHQFAADKTFIKAVIVTNQDYLDAQLKQLPVELWEQYSLFKSRPNLFEVLPKGVNKGQAVKKLAALLSVSCQDVMAVGDQENDESMIEVAGIGVAMGNATESLKAKAQYITANNNEDGVAQAIEHYMK